MEPVVEQQVAVAVGAVLQPEGGSVAVTAGSKWLLAVAAEEADAAEVVAEAEAERRMKMKVEAAELK